MIEQLGLTCHQRDHVYCTLVLGSNARVHAVGKSLILDQVEFGVAVRMACLRLAASTQSRATN